MDTWTDAMFALMASFSPSASVYFILIVILGGFFVVNLFLAVIFDEFLAAQQLNSAKDAEAERAEAAAKLEAKREAKREGQGKRKKRKKKKKRKARDD